MAAAKPDRFRVMIVDDHPLMRYGLAGVIAEELSLEMCGEASNAEEALRLLPTAKPDVVVVDLTLGPSSGLELIKKIKAYDPGVRVLVNSMHEERLYAERAIRAGAMGYVSKQVPLSTLIEAILRVLGGTVYVSPHMADRVIHRVARGGATAELSPIERLTDRELEVFGHMGAGLTTRQIAERLHLSPKTIETHRDHIKAKLRVSNNNELVRQAVEWALQDA